MDIKTISVALAIVTVSAVIFGALLPMFQDVTATEDTFTNEGLIYAEPITDDANITLKWEYTNPNQITKNDDKVIPLPTGASFPMTVAFSKSWMLRAQPGNNGYSQVFVDTSPSTTISASVSNETDMLIEIVENTVTFTVGTTIRTYDVDGGLVINDTGPYVMKKSTDSAYFDENSIAYIAGYTFHPFDGTGGLINIFSYSLNDGVNIWGIFPEGATHTETVTKTDVSGYRTLVNLTDIKMAVTNTEDVTGNVTYNQFFVPVEVNAERTAHVDGPTGAIIDLIPLIVALSIVILAIGWFITRKL